MRRQHGCPDGARYKEAGYTGIIVTDHFFYGNTSVDRSLPWEEWVRRFCLGYEHAKAEGERIGLSVFFGWEACYEGTEFLVYGLDQAWLLAHPQIKDASIREQYALVHEGGGIISHAHPVPGGGLYSRDPAVSGICGCGGGRKRHAFQQGERLPQEPAV